MKFKEGLYDEPEEYLNFYIHF